MLFIINPDGRTTRENLVPVADMVNCKEPPDTKEAAFAEPGPADGQVQLLADRSVEAGDQIFKTYGGKSGLETLYYVEPPVNDCVWIDNASGKSRPRWKCVGKEYVKKITNLKRMRKSVEHALSNNTFEAADSDQDTKAIHFRRQEKRLLTALLHEIDVESAKRQQQGAMVPDSSQVLPTSPTGFSLGGLCGNDDTVYLQKKADALNRWATQSNAQLKVKVAPVPDMRMGAVATEPVS